MTTELPRGLYAITDPALTPGERLLPACEAALAGGAVMLQYRDKNATDGERRRRAGELRRLCRRYGAYLIINDDPQLALAVKADGVHIGQRDADLAQTRRQLGTGCLIGVSCHGEASLARAAEAGGANYAALGRFFPSRTKPDAPAAHIDTLAALHRELKLPLVAIGGVNPDNAPQLIRAGAHMVAVIHSLFASEDIEATARRFQALFRHDAGTDREEHS